MNTESAFEKEKNPYDCKSVISEVGRSDFALSDFFLH